MKKVLISLPRDKQWVTDDAQIAVIQTNKFEFYLSKNRFGVCDIFIPSENVKKLLELKVRVKLLTEDGVILSDNEQTDAEDKNTDAVELKSGLIAYYSSDEYLYVKENILPLVTLKFDADSAIKH